MPNLDELRRLLEQATPGAKLRWNELTREVELPLSDIAIAAAGSNRPRATALAMIAAYEALPELLDTIDRLREENDRLERSLDRAWRNLEP